MLGGGRLSPQATVPAPAVSEPFAAELWQASLTPVAYASHSLHGRILMQQSAKMLLIHWSYDSDDGRRLYSAQECALGFWPTAVYARDNTLFVAGKSPDTGNTLVERWTLQFKVLPAGSMPEIVKATIYSAKTTGRRGVRLLEGLATEKGPGAGGLLVQFDDSRDFYTMDKQDGSLTRQLSASEYPSFKAVDVYHYYSGEHAERGFFYHMTGTYGSKSKPGALLLFDTDGNGVLDEVREVNTRQEFEDLLGEPGEWTQLFF